MSRDVDHAQGAPSKMSEMPDEPEVEVEYDSGPFCRHWADLYDCDLTCATCGHECRNHEYGEPGECLIDGCKCEEWNGE